MRSARQDVLFLSDVIDHMSNDKPSGQVMASVDKLLLSLIWHLCVCVCARARAPVCVQAPVNEYLIGW